MSDALSPEGLLEGLRKGRLAPVSLFYGSGEFRMERALDQVKASLIPEGVKAFNLEILYGGETGPEEILQRARPFPFLAERRLILVRRTEAMSHEELERFLPYFEEPVPSTCLIFVSAKAEFNKPFYRSLRSHGWAVNFEELKPQEAVPWITKTASEMGFSIDVRAATYLTDIIGNKAGDLYSELEKLQLQFGGGVRLEQVKESVKHSRIYTIFELMNRIAYRKPQDSFMALTRFLEEEDKRDAPLRVIGMLNRQMRQLWQVKALVGRGGETMDVMKKLGVHRFGASELLKQAKQWKTGEIEGAFELLYEADGRIKSGSRAKPVLESLILSLCGGNLS